MRILIYAHAFAPMIGGVETVVMSLATGLAGLKQADATTIAQVIVVTPTPRGAFDDQSLPFQVVRQPSLRELVRLIWVADVVHLAGPVFLPMLAAILLRKPVVVEHHGFQAICPNGQLLYDPTQSPCPGHFMAGRHRECIRCNAKNGLLRSSLMWFLTSPRRWLCGRVQVNITPTHWLARLLELSRSTTIHHGLRLDAAGKIPQPAPSCSTFAFVGRLVSTKGVQTLLPAAQRLRAEGFRFRLKVIGDGPDRESLRHQASAMGLGESMEFLGHLSPEGLEDHLAEAGTVVMPSLAGEVFGMVAAESMSRGKLVVVSDVGAMREVIGDAGLWFAPGDIKGLTSCLQRVLNEPELTKELGKKARQRAVQFFREERMVAEHLAVYRQLCRDKMPPQHFDVS